MIYENSALDQIQREYERLQGKCHSLLWNYQRAGTRFAVERAREYAHHGFCRRLRTLECCIVRIFETIPPDCTRQPDESQLLDVTIFLQAFYLNVFGCIDNLAHIWVQEKKVTRPEGRELPNSAVGFGQKYSEVWCSLSDDFRNYISGPTFQEWYRVIGDYRHALTHRISLYIPPFRVDSKDISKFNKIESNIDAAVDRGNYSDALDLRKQQEALGDFVPGMTHSFTEGACPLLFHPQVLADFNTVEELAIKLLAVM